MTLLGYPFTWLPLVIVFVVLPTILVPFVALVFGFLWAVAFLVVGLVAAVAAGSGLLAASRRDRRSQAGDEDVRARLGKEAMSAVGGYAGDFLLVSPVEGHPVGTLVQVSVSALHPTRLLLDFSADHQVLTDACVLLCGHTGALRLLEAGYTGPYIGRPRMAARRARTLPDGADVARPTTQPMQRN